MKLQLRSRTFEAVNLHDLALIDPDQAVLLL